MLWVFSETRAQGRALNFKFSYEHFLQDAYSFALLIGPQDIPHTRPPHTAQTYHTHTPAPELQFSLKRITNFEWNWVSMTLSHP